MRIQLHSQGAQLRLHQLDFQLSRGVLLFSITLVVANATDQEECGPEDDEIIDDLSIQLEGQPLPVSHVHAADGPSGEAEHPQHFLPDTDHNAEWNSVGENTAKACLLNLISQPEPEQPATDTPDEILCAPRPEQHQEIYLVLPHAVANPGLERKKSSHKDKAAYKNGGMHYEWFRPVFNSFNELQDKILNSLSLSESMPPGSRVRVLRFKNPKSLTQTSESVQLCVAD